MKKSIVFISGVGIVFILLIIIINVWVVRSASMRISGNTKINSVSLPANKKAVTPDDNRKAPKDIEKESPIDQKVLLN